MKKQNLVICIIFSILTILNVILHIILASVGVVEGAILVYLFFAVGLILVWLPFAIHKIFKVDLNIFVIVLYQIFLFVSLILGSAWKFYYFFEYFDIIIHCFSGFLIVVLANNIISQSKTISMGIVWKMLITFSIAMMIGAIWEIWEFVCDGLLGYDAQHTLSQCGRNAIMDTMLDIISDFFGAIIASVGLAVVDKRKKEK